MTTRIEKIHKIRELTAEQDRLLQMLEFYNWLEEHGTSWDQVKGIRPLDNTPRHFSEFRASCRRHNLMHIWEKYNTADMVYVSCGYMNRWVKYDPEVHVGLQVEHRSFPYRGRFIDIMLKNGEQLVLPWPPYPENVIYNRK